MKIPEQILFTRHRYYIPFNKNALDIKTCLFVILTFVLLHVSVLYRSSFVKLMFIQCVCIDKLFLLHKLKTQAGHLQLVKYQKGKL